MAVFKSKAMHMYFHAEGAQLAMKNDKAWEKSYDKYLIEKEQQAKEHDKKIVMRAKEVAAAAEARVKEQEQIDEREREQLISRLLSEETARNEAILKSSTEFAENLQQHAASAQEAQRRLREKHAVRMVEEESRRRAQGKAQMEDALRRVNDLKKKRGETLKEQQAAYVLKRESIAERKKDMASKRAEGIKEIKQRQKAKTEYLTQWEAKRQAELQERREMAEYDMIRTSRSHQEQLGSSGAELTRKWNEQIARTESRNKQRLEKQRMACEAHTQRLIDVTRRRQEMKEEQEVHKAEAMRAKALATAERMAEIEKKQKTREEALAKKMQHEFHVKYTLQEEEWNQMVKKAPPNEVTDVLGKLKVPLPSIKS